LNKKKGAGNGALFVLRRRIECTGQTEKFQRSGARCFVAAHNGQKRGSKPRGAGVNFTAAMQFYTNAKL